MLHYWNLLKSDYDIDFEQRIYTKGEVDKTEG